MRTLGDLVRELGLSYVVYLLAAVAEQQRDCALAADDTATAMRWAHDGKVLGHAAIGLLE
jgi:hypothetical protein